VKYTWEQIAESQDFEHGQEFIKIDDVVLILRAISMSLLPGAIVGEVEGVRREIEKIIKELEEK
jgi:hypothetical protein